MFSGPSYGRENSSVVPRLRRIGRLNTWEEFVTTLIVRFGPTTYDDPMEHLTKLRQTGTVADYQADFEALSKRPHVI